jgi:hypothetical protein
MKIMRTIKFRAWDSEINKMVSEFDHNYIISADYGDLCCGKFDHYKDYQELALMQFTGLKDKNGKEIYDGDILTLPNMGKGTIEWYHCGFILRLQSEIIWQQLLFNVVGHYTIIGNIYQNPELIKQK